MKWKPVAVCGVVGLSLAVLVWAVSRPNYRELRLGDGTDADAPTVLVDVTSTSDHYWR